MSTNGKTMFERVVSGAVVPCRRLFQQPTSEAIGVAIVRGQAALFVADLLADAKDAGR